MDLQLRNVLSGFLLLLVACLVTGRRADAYTTVGGQWPQPGGDGTPLTVTYSYQNLLDGGLKMPNGQPLPPSLIRDSIEMAFGLWSSVVPIHFVEVPDDGKQYGLSTKFGQIRLRHVYINGPDPPDPAPPIAKAQAYYPFGGDGAGDVEFDDSDPWQEFGTLHVPDILGAATHEIGHTLGLGHSDEVGANMYWIFRRTQGLSDALLLPDDILGIRSIYGAGVGSVTVLPVPEPATWIMLTATLWALLTSRPCRAVPTPRS